MVCFFGVLVKRGANFESYHVQTLVDKHEPFLPVSQPRECAMSTLSLSVNLRGYVFQQHMCAIVKMTVETIVMRSIAVSGFISLSTFLNNYLLP